VRDGGHLYQGSKRGEGQQGTGASLKGPRYSGADHQIHLPPREERHSERVEAAEEAHCSLLYIQGDPLIMRPKC